jgi:hypothetical protein
MFCDQCQLFWKEAIAKAKIPEVIKTCEDVRWVAYELVLHRSVRALKRASELGCRTCRIAFSIPTSYEHDILLHDQDEPIDVMLSIDPDKGPHPSLLVEFREATGGGIRILKRMVAICNGLLCDGTSKWKICMFYR